MVERDDIGERTLLLKVELERCAEAMAEREEVELLWETAQYATWTIKAAILVRRRKSIVAWDAAKQALDRRCSEIIHAHPSYANNQGESRRAQSEHARIVRDRLARRANVVGPKDPAAEARRREWGKGHGIIEHEADRMRKLGDV